MAKGALAPPGGVPKEWAQFIKQYGMDLAYWYVPKGLAVEINGVRDRLAVLKEFAGSKPWRDCQSAYVARLNEERISDADSEWEDGGAPLARMLKQVLVTLGLAWVNPNERVEITPAGEAFLAAEDHGAVLSDQVSRFQLWNPSIRSRDHTAIRVHPLPFLGEVLRSVTGSRISATEYNLFVSRAKTFDDVDRVLELIEAYRNLADEQQVAIVDRCNSYMLGGTKRSSMYNTVALNRPYAFRFFGLSRLITIHSGVSAGLSLNRAALKDYRGYLHEYADEGAYIHFANEKDWIAYYGDPDAKPTRETALEYYINKSDVDGAVSIQKSRGKTGKEITEFRRMMISEKTLEDYLVGNLDEIGGRIGVTLRLVGRQYSTPVGPVDILAQVPGTGQYVVIELKKGRSADRVFGQLSRYMGWVKTNLAEGDEVRGVIVSRKIDDKLKAAKAAHMTKVDLIQFEMNFGATVVI